MNTPAEMLFIIFFNFVVHHNCMAIYVSLQTMYVMMDGAPVNRAIVKQVLAQYGSYSCPNGNTKEDKITFIMDPKVNIPQSTL